MGEYVAKELYIPLMRSEFNLTNVEHGIDNFPVNYQYVLVDILVLYIQKLWLHACLGK